MLMPTVVRNPRPDPGDSPIDPGERVRLLVVEPTPLVALAWAGWMHGLVLATRELLISDVAYHDADRTPEVASWLAPNRDRYGLVETTTWREYEKAMKVWERIGRPDDTEPRRPTLDLMDVLNAYEAAGKGYVVLADDARARAVVRTFDPAARVIGSATALMWRDITVCPSAERPYAQAASKCSL